MNNYDVDMVFSIIDHPIITSISHDTKSKKLRRRQLKKKHGKEIPAQNKSPPSNLKEKVSVLHSVAEVKESERSQNKTITPKK